MPVASEAVLKHALASCVVEAGEAKPDARQPFASVFPENAAEVESPTKTLKGLAAVGQCWAHPDQRARDAGRVARRLPLPDTT